MAHPNDINHGHWLAFIRQIPPVFHKQPLDDPDVALLPREGQRHELARTNGSRRGSPSASKARKGGAGLRGKKATESAKERRADGKTGPRVKGRPKGKGAAAVPQEANEETEDEEEEEADEDGEEDEEDAEEEEKDETAGFRVHVKCGPAGCGQEFVLQEGVEKWGIFTCPCCWNVTRNTAASRAYEANKIVDVVAGKGAGMLCTHKD